VGFKLYQDLVWDTVPPVVAENMCPLTVACFMKRHREETDPQELLKLFEAHRRLWKTSTTCAQLIKKLKESNISPGINKVVCFGLGTLMVDLESLKENPDQLLSRTMTQHAAALTMAEVLKNMTGKEIRLLAQDPVYNSASKHILRHVGFHVLEGYGGLGFLEVDESSLVFTVACNVPVKQVVVDLTRPAVMIWHPTRPDKTDSPNWSKQKFEVDGKTTESWVS
jgi:hypothetical protein